MYIINYLVYVFYIDSRHYEIMVCDIKITIVFTGEWDSLGVRFNNGSTPWVVIQNRDNYMWLVSVITTDVLSCELCWQRSQSFCIDLLLWLITFM